MQTLARLVRASGFRAASAGVAGHGMPMGLSLTAPFSSDFSHPSLLTKRSRVASGNQALIEVVILMRLNDYTGDDDRKRITTKEFGDPQLLPDILRKEIRTFNAGDWICINSTTSVWCDVNDTVGDALEMIIPYDDTRGTITHNVVIGNIDYPYAKCIFYKDESYKTVLDFTNHMPAPDPDDRYICLQSDTKLWEAKQLIDGRLLSLSSCLKSCSEQPASISWFDEGGQRLHSNYFRNTEFIWTICSGKPRLTSRRRINENQIWLDLHYPLQI